MKIYGPYTRKDGRKTIIEIYDDGRRRSVSYPKWLKEQTLGRILDPNSETIDHIDRNFNNNDDSNLRVLPRSEHTSLDVIRVMPVEIVCVWCGEPALKKPNQLRHNSNLGKAGPFCSRRCAGKYGAEIQNGRASKLPIQPSPESITYTLKDIK